ncbi:response regulator transcription factor [Balneatrix alpica]|uniref:response regulator transcription factor n=1 Tax=Balneatrix alpica TaxID=75684 RepID=UPI0027382BBC|nr:response regulator transcription factor [Balneatrix alpica]
MTEQRQNQGLVWLLESPYASQTIEPLQRQLSQWGYDCQRRPRHTLVEGAGLCVLALAQASQWREWSQGPQQAGCPLVVLLETGGTEERIQLLQQGAVEVLTAPFHPQECALRIQAWLRWQASGPAPCNQRLQLDKRLYQVRYGAAETSLTPTQFRLLQVLVEHPGQVLSKSYLSEQVLQKHYCSFDRSLDMHLSRVRRKLIELGVPADRLQTAHGQGYRFQ